MSRDGLYDLIELRNSIADAIDHAQACSDSETKEKLRRIERDVISRIQGTATKSNPPAPPRN